FSCPRPPLRLTPLPYTTLFRSLWPLDVLQVDPAEGRLERRHHVDQAVDLARIHLDVEHIDAGEFLEQDRLALHHRLAGERADIADRKSTRLNSSHLVISYAVFC